jgi:lysyl-tRNA synthetase, class II
MPTLDDLMITRSNKLKSLQKLGLNPFPGSIKRDQAIGQAREMDGKNVAIVGRISAQRGHGKISFTDLKDATGQIQAVFKIDEIKPDTFKILDFCDIGDFLAVQGKVGKTTAGEISVFVTDFQLISKSLRPLPDKWHGLSDVEERYRQRYVDLLVNDDVKKIFTVRTKVVKFLRDFLDRDGFMEMETPVLQPLYGGASAKPFVTHHNTLDEDLYLRISDELYLKRLIVGGFEKVYEVGRDFRNEGMDREHNPEFTMLEFYWAYANYSILMEYTEKMLSELVKSVNGSPIIEFEDQKLDFTPPWPRRTYRDVVLEYSGIDIDQADDEKKLLDAIHEHNIKLDLKGVIGYGALLDTLYKATARPKLIGPMFLIDRPTAFVALAKRLPKDPRYTASFQALVVGRELLNAYNELNDPIDQAARWHESEKLGEKGQTEYEKFDFDYIRALEYGMPPTAGWGMGIDRLVAILTNQHSIKDVILFPTLRPEIFNQKDSEKITPVNKKSLSSENVLSEIDERKVKNMDLGIDYPKAKKLMEEYIKDPITRLHCVESEAIMRALAKHFGENEEQWGIIGLLHDIDWELTKTNTKMHCIKTAEILRENGGTEYLIETIQSHGYGQGFGDDYYGPPEFKGKTRNGKIQHALAAAETSTGLIIASTLVQPDKKLSSLKLESLIKKFKSKGFAANCRREIIMECEQIGLTLDEFLKLGLTALQEIHTELGF